MFDSMYDGWGGVRAALHLHDYLTYAGSRHAHYMPLEQLRADVAGLYDTSERFSVFDAWCEQHLTPILSALARASFQDSARQQATYQQQHAAWRAALAAYKQQFCVVPLLEYMRLVGQGDFELADCCAFKQLVRHVNMCRCVLFSSPTPPLPASAVAEYIIERLEASLSMKVSMCLFAQQQHDAQHAIVSGAGADGVGVISPCPLEVLARALWCIGFAQPFVPLAVPVPKPTCAQRDSVQPSHAIASRLSAPASPERASNDTVVSVPSASAASAVPACLGADALASTPPHVLLCEPAHGTHQPNFPSAVSSVSSRIDLSLLLCSALAAQFAARQLCAVQLCFVWCVAVQAHCFRPSLIDALIRWKTLACPAIKGVDFSPTMAFPPSILVAPFHPRALYSPAGMF